MKKLSLSPRLKKWLVALHVLCMATWFGGTLGLLTLNIVLAQAGTVHELAVTDANLHVIDEIFIKFPALATLISGLLLAVLTNWGLTKYYWVITKQVLTVGIIAFGIFALNRWTAEASGLISSQGWEALQIPLYALNRNRILAGAVLNSLALAFIVVITYLKPWGKRR